MLSARGIACSIIDTKNTATRERRGRKEVKKGEAERKGGHKKRECVNACERTERDETR